MSSFQWEDIDPGAGNLVVGKISNINSGALTATVEGVGDNIPIHYHCDSDSTDDGKTLSEAYPDDLDLEGAQAFVDGDDVLVVFRKLNNREPMIIGFPDYPHSCHIPWEPFGNDNSEVCKYHNWAYRGDRDPTWYECSLSGSSTWNGIPFDHSMGYIHNGKLFVNVDFNHGVAGYGWFQEVNFNWKSSDEDPSFYKEFMFVKLNGKIAGTVPPGVNVSLFFALYITDPRYSDRISLTPCIYAPGKEVTGETLFVGDLRKIMNENGSITPWPAGSKIHQLGLNVFAWVSSGPLTVDYDISIWATIDYIDFLDLDEIEQIYPAMYSKIMGSLENLDTTSLIASFSNKNKPNKTLNNRSFSTIIEKPFYNRRKIS